MTRRRRSLSLGAALLTVMLLTGPAAAISVLFTSENIGGGLFEYRLLVSNMQSPEPIIGLNILHGGSVFDLDDTSIVDAPVDWSFFAPSPPFFDELNFFTAGPGIPVGGSLGGFSFVSSTNPDTLSGDDFAFDVIGAMSATQIFMGVAQQISHPATVWLVALGAGFGLLSRIARSMRGPRP